MQLTWKYHSFNEITTSELYAIIRLRNEVFVVEQNAVYQDADNKDLPAYHLSGWDDNYLVAYCRILPPGLAFEEASIGRVVTASKYRGTGMGRHLVQLAIAHTLDQYQCKNITIGAQVYLENFYRSFGFLQISEPYMEDGILHIEMQLNT